MALSLRTGRVGMARNGSSSAGHVLEVYHRELTYDISTVTSQEQAAA